MGTCSILKSGSGSLDTDELTAVTADVLSGKIAGVSGTDEPVTGTMPNRGAISQSLNAGGSYSIPAGYHNGAGKVTANSLSSQTSANATAAQILSGQTAWVNGAKVTGSMTNRGAVNQALTINGSYTIPAGYHNGSGKVTQSVPVQGGSTTTPGTANKTVVAANRYVNGNVVVAGNGNLTAGNIKKGISIFGVTGNFQGYVPSPTDLYLRGNNIGNFYSVEGSYCTPNFDTGQMTLIKGPNSSTRDGAWISKDLTGFSYFNCEGVRAAGQGSCIIGIQTSAWSSGNNVIASASTPNSIVTNSTFVLKLDISQLNAVYYIRIYPSASTTINIFRVWLT